MSSRTALWGLAALLGIAVTATLAWTASQIAGQRIGLASEPLSVSSGLAPSAAPAAQGGHLTRRAHHRVTRHTPPRVPTVTSTSAAAPPTTSAQSAPAPIALPTTTQAAPAPAPATATTASRTQQSQSSGGHDDNGGGGASSGGGGGSSGGGSHRDD